MRILVLKKVMRKAFSKGCIVSKASTKVNTVFSCWARGPSCARSSQRNKFWQMSGISVLMSGATPDIRTDIPLICQNLLRCDDLAQDGPRAQQLNTVFTFVEAFETIHPFENAFLITFFKTRMRIVFVHQSDVIENILLVLHHATQTITDNDCDLVTKGGVITNAVGNDRSLYMTVSIFVLQTLAV